MNYTDYLNSEHWLHFRREILSTRRCCQNCASTNNTLNVHHKHYRTVGAERQEDVILLCQDCHLRFHKKGRWLKAKLKKLPLDFTGSRHPEKAYFNIASTVNRVCRRCTEVHPLIYKRQANDNLVLATICPNSKPRTEFLPFEPGLDIPILNTTARSRV